MGAGGEVRLRQRKLSFLFTQHLDMNYVWSLGWILGR